LVGDAELARALLAIADRFEVEREQELVCQLLWLTECCRNPEVISSGFGPRLGLRLVRERLLRLKLAWILESRSCRPGFERHAVAARLMTAAIAKPPAFIDSNTDFSWGSWWGILPDPRRTEQDCTAATIRLKLLAAEISGHEWPIDPYSRSGERLRRIERDGVLIGGYSIGPDERDAGGGRGDIALALYGHSGLPPQHHRRNHDSDHPWFCAGRMADRLDHLGRSRPAADRGDQSSTHHR
jgi:hypothetical protein